MQQLTTVKHPTWNSFLEGLIIEEYVAGMEKDFIKSSDRIGAPVIICPERVFDTTMDHRGRNRTPQYWGEIEFADMNLKSVAFLLYQNAISEEDAIAIYEEEFDLSTPARDVIRHERPLYLQEQGEETPLSLDGMTTDEFLELLSEGEVLTIEDDHLVAWSESEDMEHMAELLDVLYALMHRLRLNRIEILPEPNSWLGIMTEYLPSRDITELIDSYLWTDNDHRLSFVPEHEEALLARRIYPYKGGGFSCNS